MPTSGPNMLSAADNLFPDNFSLLHPDCGLPDSDENDLVPDPDKNDLVPDNLLQPDI